MYGPKNIALFVERNGATLLPGQGAEILARLNAMTGNRLFSAGDQMCLQILGDPQLVRMFSQQAAHCPTHIALALDDVRHARST